MSDDAQANTAVQPEYVSVPEDWLRRVLAELTRLGERVTELEAELAVVRGTMRPQYR